MGRPREHTVVDLRALDLESGAGARLELRVVVDDLTIAGQPYAVSGGEVPVCLDVSLSPSGWLFRLRFEAEVQGPCLRCLDLARVPIAIDARDFAATDRPPGAPFDEDLDSEYLEGERLDVSAWTRDSIAEALPDIILCREDCTGLCPTCGANLNLGSCACRPAEEGDARWAPLRALAERLREEGGGAGR